MAEVTIPPPRLPLPIRYARITLTRPGMKALTRADTKVFVHPSYAASYHPIFQAPPPQLHPAIIQQSHQISTTNEHCGIFHWCFHLPDDISIDLSGFTPWVVGGGANITLTRDGHLYIAPELGVGVPGISGMVRAGWIGGPQSAGVSEKARDSFVHGNSFTAAAEAPGPFLVGGAETWGNPNNPLHMFGAGASNNFATEAGWAGLGAPA